MKTPLRLFSAPKKVTIDTSVGQDGTIPPNVAGKLIRAIVSQAYVDGMNEIEMTADCAENSVSMRYHGPLDSEKPQWWEK